MPLVASECLTQSRIDLATPGGTNVRWSDTQLLSLIDRGVKRLVAEVLFPETRLTINTRPGVNEYPLPDTHVIHRVYVNGQSIVPVPGGIETLEGHQILSYDQGGQYGQGQNAAGLSSGTYSPFYLSPASSLTPTVLGTESGFAIGTESGAEIGIQVGSSVSPPSGGSGYGSAAPFGSQGTEMPEWLVQTPTSYPFLNSWGAPAPEAAMWSSGSRPRYYINGGNIGLVPAPSGTSQLVIDCVLVPQTITSSSAAVAVPDNFMDGIVAYVCWRASRANAMSDRSPASGANRNEAMQELVSEERKLRTWKRQFTLESAQSFVLTYRGAFRVGQNTVGSSGDAW